MRLVALAVVAACDAGDPCDDVAGTCATLHVESAVVDAVDQLELDVLYNDVHATLASQPGGGGTAGLPVVLGIELGAAGEIDLGVVAAGKLGGTVLGTGAVRVRAIAAGDHASLKIVLAAPPVPACEPGGFYCGGTKLSGDSDTLYKCNGGGVPLARGACKIECVEQPPIDDGCLDIAGPCVENALYCGGDKLVGDPRSLYRCMGGRGTRIKECQNGCRINPGANDDCNP
jgi:hypothetical protein